MIRLRKVFGVLAVATVAGAAVSAAPATAVVPPVVGTGTVSCQVAGSISFNPPLVVGGTAPTTVTFTTALSLCTGTGDGATVLGGSTKVVRTIAANDCLAVPDVSNSSRSGTIKWRVPIGTPKLAPTDVTLTSGSLSQGPPITVDGSGSATSGSFSGGAIVTHVQITEKAATLVSKCISLTGLKAIHFVRAASTFVLT